MGLIVRVQLSTPFWNGAWLKVLKTSGKLFCPGKFLPSPRVAGGEIVFITQLGVDLGVKLVRDQLAARGIELVEPQGSGRVAGDRDQVS